MITIHYTHGINIKLISPLNEEAGKDLKTTASTEADKAAFLKDALCNRNSKKYIKVLHQTDVIMIEN
jgi:hypothetical protein